MVIHLSFIFFLHFCYYCLDLFTVFCAKTFHGLPGNRTKKEEDSHMTVPATAVNVKESEKAYTMELAAPGIKKEYCRVAINDEGNLTIAIENKQEHKHEDKHHHYLRREFSYSNYEQSYMLPDDVVKDQISAKVEDGILTVTMPKTEPKQEKTKLNY